MPAKSEAQRRFLFWKFGPRWVKKHHFNNKGKLPKRLESRVDRIKKMVIAERLIREGRNDAPHLPLGRAGHAYYNITSKDILNQPGGTAEKWRKSMAMRKAVTNQKHVRNSYGCTVFPSMDKVGSVPSAINAGKQRP